MRPEAALEILGNPRRVRVCKFCPFAARDPETILDHQRAKHGMAGAKAPKLWRGWWRSPLYAGVGEDASD